MLDHFPHFLCVDVAHGKMISTPLILARLSDLTDYSVALVFQFTVFLDYLNDT